MSLELELARRVATTIKEAMTPVVGRILTLEAQIRIPGPIGPSGEKGLDGTPGRDGKDGMPGEKGLDGTPGRDGKDGMPGEKGLDGTPGRDGKDGAPGPPGRDGRDGQSIQGPPGEKGSAAVVESTPGLDPALIAASADALLRKEFAALEAAAPARMTKRVIRDARGKIERVIEEPTRG